MGLGTLHNRRKQIMNKYRIPFNKPFHVPQAEEYVLDALRSDGQCGNHKWCKKCADLLKDKFGFKEVFLVPSGTDALEMGCILAGLKPGDEVILPSYTFSSTGNAVVMQGAKPVFCEINPDTMNIDPDQIESLITPRTRMILPIDYAGIPCDLERINPIAEKYGLTVFVDAAQSLNSKDAQGYWSGARTPIAAFSCHETKNFGCGEGGLLSVNNPDWILQANFIQEKGTDRRLVLDGVKSKYGWVTKGSSFLLSDILAAMLYAQFEAMDEITALRGKVVDAYSMLFEPFVQKGCVKVPRPPAGTILNNHAFFVIFDSPKNRQAFLAGLKEWDISAYIGYVPLHSSTMGLSLGYKAEDLPLTENLAARVVRLPLYADLGREGLSYMIDRMGYVMSKLYSC